MSTPEDRSASVNDKLNQLLLNSAISCFAKGEIPGAIGRLRLLLSESPDYFLAEKLLVILHHNS